MTVRAIGRALVPACACLALGLAIVLAIAGPAAAQSDEAAERFEVGVALLRAGRHEQAAAAFRESYRLEPRVETMCNLALTYDRWGPEHRTQAVRAYRTCATEDGQGRFGPFAQRRVTEIERELVLEEEARAEAPADDPPATEEPPTSDAQIAPGAIPPAASAPGVERPARDHALLYVGIGAGGLALALLVPAIVLAVDSSSTVDQLRVESGPDGELVRGSAAHQRYLDAQSSATAATVLYVGAGIAAAAAATLIVLDLTVASDDAPAIVLAPSTDGAMLTVAGRF